jgi:F0F1-type ATP synthase assembly protein I
MTATCILMPEPRPTDQRACQRTWLAGMGAAWSMIGSVVIGLGLGLSLDRWLGSLPWATLACSLVFLAGGVYMVIREGSR